MTFQRFLLERKNITPEHPDNNVILMLGVPGSGKTTLLKAGIVNVDNIVHLTPDRWIDLLSKKENASLTAPEKTKELYNRVMPVFLRHSNHLVTQKAQSNFVIEMTGKNIFSIKDLLIRTKKKGFRIIAVLVQTDLKKALFNNKIRARRVPERAIIETHKQLQDNFKFVVSSGEVDEAWVINNTDTPTYKQFRSSKFIKKIK